MTPWTRLDQAQTPDGTRLELMRRGNDYSIRANGQLLMNSRVHGSEEVLAERGLAKLGERPQAHVLVGGLGCGYTLAATLARVGPNARVTVAEIVPAVVRWNRELLGELTGKPLDDRRVCVLEADICDVLRSSAASFDAILLDVDNGPRAVARRGNAWLYTRPGLAVLFEALLVGGALALWSAGPEPGFSARLRSAGFGVSLERAASLPGGRGPQHWIWLATKPARP